MSSPRLNSNMFPLVYKSLRVDTNKLGCIMLDVDPVTVEDVMPEVYSFLYTGDKWHQYLDELYYHPDKVNHPYTGGAPIRDTAHATLLYGLMEPGPTWKEEVDGVLDGWTPEDLEVDEVSYFPSNIPGQDYNVIVAKLKVTENLDEGHKRLQLLPHVDTFPTYHPHVTIAYVKGGDEIRDKWITNWGRYFNGKTLSVKGLNYGGD